MRLGEWMTDRNTEAAPEKNGSLFWVLGILAALLLGAAGWYFGTQRPVPEIAETTEAAQDQLSVIAPAEQADSAEPAPQTQPEADIAAPAENTVPAENTAPAEDAVASTGPQAEPAAAQPAADAADAPQPEAVAPDVPEESVAAADPLPPEPPAFDTVRVDRDGAVLVAGHAEAGQTVSIMVDGAEAVSAVSDGRGDFAALFSIMPSDEPRVLSLMTRMPDGKSVMSEAEVVIAPFAAPEPVTAEADEEAADTAVAETTAQEPAAPDVLIVDSSGVRLQSDGPSVDSIVIDTIGYGAEGEVEIAGRAPIPGFARLYLDNNVAATVPIGEDGGWSATLTDVAAGIYTLRVDQIDDGGQVLSRFETPFQREAPDVVIAALGATPTEDATPSPEAEAPAAPQPEVQGDAPATPASADQGETATPSPAPAAEEVPGADPPQPAEVAALPDAPTPDAPIVPARVAIVTVQPGFTLWQIARENYGDGILYVKVFEANKEQIRDPDLIYPGQVFTVPSE